MSLSVYTASAETCIEHFTHCNVMLCQICRDIFERWQAELDAEREDKWKAEYEADEKLKRQEGR